MGTILLCVQPVVCGVCAGKTLVCGDYTHYIVSSGCGCEHVLQSKSSVAEWLILVAMHPHG